MKIKCLFLTALLLTVTTIGFAQAKKPTAAVAPEQLVKDLYAAQKTEQTNPFAQIKSRALVDKYFTKDFADLVWKTNSSETGWNVDPLYNSQDPQITNFVVGAPEEDGSADNVYLKVNFKSYGKADSVGFKLSREANKIWQIDNIDYSDGDDLASILRYSTDEEYQKAHDAETFKGDYMVGAMRCDVIRTLSSIELFRVRCEGQEGFKLYAVDGNEKETAYIHTDDKGKETGKFVFKKDEKDGKFIDAAGKEVKVTRVQAAEDGKTSDAVTPASDSEIESVSGDLTVGKTESVILSVGEETGDYAAYCFTNDSDAGRAILAACKDKEKCEVTATLGEGSCKVPGLEATLSASFNLVKVASAKSLGRRK